MCVSLALSLSSVPSGGDDVTCIHTLLVFVYVQPDAGRVASVSLLSVGGNHAHCAPEVLTALRGFLASGVATVTVDFSHQAVFELGVLLCELAVRSHPLLGYPSSYLEGSGISFDDSVVREWAEGFRAKLGLAGYPSAFLALVCACVSCEPGRRPSLAQFTQKLSDMKPTTAQDREALPVPKVGVVAFSYA